jgi:hypothetical protein
LAQYTYFFIFFLPSKSFIQFYFTIFCSFVGDDKREDYAHLHRRVQDIDNNDTSVGGGDDSDDGLFKLTILHVNDVHSRAVEDTFNIEIDDLPAAIVNNLADGTDNLKVTFGGYPRLVSLFNEMQTKAESDGTNVLRLHAGTYILFELNEPRMVQ